MYTTDSLVDAVRLKAFKIIIFHDICLTMLIFVINLVFISLIKVWYTNGSNLFFSEKNKLEVFWTCWPGLFIIILGLPSILLLYSSEIPLQQVQNTYKIIAHQWYWEYDQTNCDSYISICETSNIGNFRLLEVDKPLFFKSKVQNQLLITSEDVIHSFAIPSLGLKVDAVPGRLNQLFTLCHTPGVYRGQCSEICGVNHSFMPILIEVF